MYITINIFIESGNVGRHVVETAAASRPTRACDDAQSGKSAFTVIPIVEQVTGRQARTFAQWVSENLHRFE
jgi:hypothetical protein